MESGTALHRIGGSISHVTWSPCDTKVFVATKSSLIRYSNSILSLTIYIQTILFYEEILSL